MKLSEMIARIRQLDKDLIPEALEDLERFRAIAMSTTPRYENDGSQHTENGNGKERAFIECSQASIKVDKLQDELADLKILIIKEVEKVSNDKQRRMAKNYYIDQLTQKEIAKKTHYEYGTVRNELSNFRKKLNIVTPNDTK